MGMRESKSPGKRISTTGLKTMVGVCVWVHGGNDESCAVLSRSDMSTLWDTVDWSPPSSSIHRESPGKNTGVDCHALLQGIFPTQGSNTGLPHSRQILYCLSDGPGKMRVQGHREHRAWDEVSELGADGQSDESSHRRWTLQGWGELRRVRLRSLE